MVTTDGEFVVIHFQCETEEITQLVSMTLDAAFEGNGNILLTLQSLKGGKLPLSLNALTGILQKNAPDNHFVKQMIDKMAKLFDGARFLARYQYDQQRDLTVDGVEFVGDKGDAAHEPCAPQPPNPIGSSRRRVASSGYRLFVHWHRV